jgi:hypothetical protein
MELQQNLRRAATRPMAWGAAVSVALLLALIGWYMFPIGPLNHATGIRTQIVTSVESPRAGGPGGQFGDAPLPDQTSRVGGPGGQVGDAP